MYSLYLLLFLVDSKESSFSPRVPRTRIHGACIRCIFSCFWWTVKKVASLRASPNPNTRRVYSLYLLLFLVDSKESSFSPRVPAPEYTTRVFAVSSLVFGGQ